MGDAATSLTGFGAAVKRKEDPALLRGEGCYVDDIRLPGMLHAAFVRSPHAHARVGTIDKSAALALTGVHAVITYSDLPECVQRQTLPLLVPHPALKQPRMPYALAEDEASAARAPQERGGPRVQAGADSNIAARFPVRVGDADRAFSGATRVFRERIHQH